MKSEVRHGVRIVVFPSLFGSQCSMASGFQTPSINWSSDNLPDAFSSFRQYCQLIFDGPYSTKSEKEKVTYLLLWIGRQGLDVYNSFTWDNADDRHKLTEVWLKFSDHIEPKVNSWLARYTLQQFRQSPEESVDTFISRCRTQAAKCKFKDADETNSRLIELLIVGTKHPEVQAKILEKGDGVTSLDAVMEIARTYEATKGHVAQLQARADVHIVRKSEPKPGNAGSKCSRCGTQHAKNKSACPAIGQKCNKCGFTGHWAAMCKSKKVATASQSRQPCKSQQSKSIHAVKEDESDVVDTLVFECIDVHRVTASHRDTATEIRTTVNFTLGSRTAQLKGKVDTGAQGSILPLRLYRTMFPDNILPSGMPKPGVLEASDTKLTAYGGAPLQHYGIVKLRCELNELESTESFFVTHAEGPAIFGLPLLRALNMIQVSVDANCLNQPEAAKDALLREWPNCFKGIGKLPGKYHITLDPAAEPVVHSPRRVPIALADDIKAELQDMESSGIIKKVTEGQPTDWVNSLVYRRKKNGKIRICLDPKDLNKAIKRDYHVTPTVEEIIPKLNGAKHFSILDAKCGYWNVELDEPSSFLTTFNSPCGRYRFLRMPFGLRMSQDVFQARIDQLVEGLTGVIGIADDIVVFGKSKVDHCMILGIIPEEQTAT